MIATAVRYTVGKYTQRIVEQEKRKTAVRCTVDISLAVWKEDQRAEMPGVGWGGMGDE